MDAVNGEAVSSIETLRREMTGEGLVNTGLWWFGRITEEYLLFGKRYLILYTVPS
jgi:hypothetical protein